MDTYKIVFNGLHGFGVDVLTDDGTECVRGLPTYAAAQSWIKRRRRTTGDIPAWHDTACRAAPASAPPS